MYIWTLKAKQINRNRLINTEKKRVADRQDWGKEWAKWVKETESYKLQLRSRCRHK